MTGRHLVNRRIVVQAVIDEVERLVAHAIGKRKRLTPPLYARATTVLVFDEIGDTLALDRVAVDMEQAVDHLDAIAGQPDDAPDAVGGHVLRQAEHHDIASLGRHPEYATVDGRPQPPWKRIGPITVRKLRNKYVITNQDRRLH